MRTSLASALTQRVIITEPPPKIAEKRREGAENGSPTHSPTLFNLRTLSFLLADEIARRMKRVHHIPNSKCSRAAIFGPFFTRFPSSNLVSTN